MKETGIVMTGSHPRDILERRKTQTRRTWGLEVINLDPDRYTSPLIAYTDKGCFAHFIDRKSTDPVKAKCPYGGIGDLLWVKEGHAISEDGKHILYRADYDELWRELELEEFIKERGLPKPLIKWRPSIHMFRKHSRITKLIADLKAERLQDISYEDAKAEGYNSISGFAVAWNEINGKRYPWSGNWWVWAISF